MNYSKSSNIKKDVNNKYQFLNTNQCSIIEASNILPNLEVNEKTFFNNNSICKLLDNTSYNINKKDRLISNTKSKSFLYEKPKLLSYTINKSIRSCIKKDDLRSKLDSIVYKKNSKNTFYKLKKNNNNKLSFENNKTYYKKKIINKHTSYNMSVNNIKSNNKNNLCFSYIDNKIKANSILSVNLKKKQLCIEKKNEEYDIFEYIIKKNKQTMCNNNNDNSMLFQLNDSSNILYNKKDTSYSICNYSSNNISLGIISNSKEVDNVFELFTYKCNIVNHDYFNNKMKELNNKVIITKNSSFNNENNKCSDNIKLTNLEGTSSIYFNISKFNSSMLINEVENKDNNTSILYKDISFSIDCKSINKNSVNQNTINVYNENSYLNNSKNSSSMSINTVLSFEQRTLNEQDDNELLNDYLSILGDINISRKLINKFDDEDFNESIS